MKKKRHFEERITRTMGRCLRRLSSSRTVAFLAVAPLVMQWVETLCGRIHVIITKITLSGRLSDGHHPRYIPTTQIAKKKNGFIKCCPINNVLMDAAP